LYPAPRDCRHIEVNDVQANLAGYGIGFALSFVLNEHWMFRHDGSSAHSFVLFGAVLGVSYFMSLSVVMVCSRWLGISVYVAELLDSSSTRLRSFWEQGTWSLNAIAKSSYNTNPHIE
jgi:putative flippase GtrA